MLVYKYMYVHSTSKKEKTDKVHQIQPHWNYTLSFSY